MSFRVVDENFYPLQGAISMKTGFFLDAMPSILVDCDWNVMAHAQKHDFVFRWNGQVHLNPRGRQFSRLLAAEVCASALVMLDTPRSEVVWRVLATNSIRQFPLHFPSRASPCAITFQLDSKQLLTCCIQLASCNLNLQAAGCSETSVLIYRSKSCNVLADRNGEAANFVCVGGYGKAITLLVLES
jgi:hypothetical protein